MDFAQRLTEAERIARIKVAQRERIRAAIARVEEIERHCETIARAPECPAPPDAEDE